ncbi:SAM-dependent methyltransferase [Actinomycetospora sp. NBRC 106378]|uniref:SAM-dependent methyltransferase n=1 Tax=Actinomycetospora sp. NBRC 106378 TaxID=3032208 RepID=UPI0024A188AD|nr:SAM-dependent methyltransferase [Actinomycetospora sp. NBRC 106378]GLZ54751.1 putative S-adenosyl-L-methionine-dependent methyltransferase [Actinomycetospora sp. NBRC 106378]
MRTEGDRWDIVSSVGWTALMVAAGRAVERHRPDPLVDDPWAEHFVGRADTPQPLPTHPDQPWPDPERVDGERTVVDEFWTVMSTYQGVRSRFFDRALLDAGVDQVVLLAVGLDARAYRLDWPAGTTVFEIDQEQVLDFKDEVLTTAGAAQRCRRVAVGVDLRDDWVGALRAAGFDADRPSAFLAEGLLPFLPAAAESELLRLVGTLTAPGSTLVVENFAAAFAQLQHDPALPRFGRPFGVEMTGLVDLTEQRPHPAEALRGDGWQVEVTAGRDVAQRWGRPLETMSTGTTLDSEFVVARR